MKEALKKLIFKGDRALWILLAMMYLIDFIHRCLTL